MTISVTAIGGQTSITSTTSLSYIFANSYGGSSSKWGVCVVACDNSGSSGAAPTCGVTDDVGNTWTQRQAALYDPGAASAGTTLFLFTAPWTVMSNSADSITATFSPASTSKAMYIWEITSSQYAYMTYLSSNKNTGASTSTPTVTTDSIPSGGVVIGAGAAETNTSWTGDSDTSDGSWSTAQQKTASHGSGDLYSQSLTTQYKVVTSSGTQTYNPTLGAAKDCILVWVAYYENIPATSYDPMGRMGYYGI